MTIANDNSLNEFIWESIWRNIIEEWISRSSDSMLKIEEVTDGKIIFEEEDETKWSKKLK